MNRNRKKAVAASVAVGMTVVMGASPILAADTDISKEETVYVNAAADGTPEDITVSDWLKNSASAGDLSDESDLKDIKNVKGDETFEQDGSNLTWNTEDKDIYYQGTTNKDLPVSMEIKYYLDGVQVSPSDLGGKSGHLKIEVNYTNNVKNKTKVGKKTTDVYAPFVMATAMILPTDNFTNVTIDNGKVLSDGQRNIAIGVGMPGLADSLDLKSIDEDIDLDIPEGFTMEADVTDFSMSSTFTFALTDLLNSLDLNDVDGLDDLKDLPLVHNGAEGAVHQTLAAVDAFFMVDVRPAILVLADGVHAAGLLTGPQEFDDGLIGAGGLALAALDAGRGLRRRCLGFPKGQNCVRVL